MSSNCPPQLHLELPPNTTSFKRSFDQFGFDLESPLGSSDGAGSSGSDGNDRNKRARSASSFSDDDNSVHIPHSSSMASSSSSTSASENEFHHQSALSATRPTVGAPHFSLSITRSPLEPPRLPTPELQDIVMVDCPLVDPHRAEQQESPSAPATTTVATASTQIDDNYRLSLERFNAFDSQISALRRSRSPSLVRSPTPPPVLPPLTLLSDQTQLNTNGIPFLHPPTQPSPPLPESLYSFSLTRSQRPGSRSTTRDNSQHNSRISHHEPHRQAESSTSPRAFSPPPFLNVGNNWSRTSREERSAELTQFPHPWSYWSPNADGENDDDDEDEGDEDEDEEDGREERGIFHRRFRGDSPIPAIAEIRSPSPLFEDLDILQSSSSNPRQTAIHTTPPILPPLHWDNPLEILQMADSLAHPSARPLYRLNIPRDLDHEREEAHTATSAPSSSDDHLNTHTLPSPFLRDLGGWMDTDPTVFGLSPDWSVSSASSTGTDPPSSSSGSVSVHRASGNNTSRENADTITNSESDLNDNFSARMERIEALHGIGGTVQGLGRALQENEMTSRPLHFRLGGPSSPPPVLVSTSTENSSRSSLDASISSRSSQDARENVWRPMYTQGQGQGQISGSSAQINTTESGSRNESNINRDRPAVSRRLGLGAPLVSPLESHMRPWLAERLSRRISPSPGLFTEQYMQTILDEITRESQSSTETGPPLSRQNEETVRNRTSLTSDGDSTFRSRVEEGVLSAPTWYNSQDIGRNQPFDSAQVTSTRGDIRRNSGAPESPTRLPTFTGSTWPWTDDTAVENGEPTPEPATSSSSPSPSDDLASFPPILGLRTRLQALSRPQADTFSQTPAAADPTPSTAPSGSTMTSEPTPVASRTRVRSLGHGHAQSIDGSPFRPRWREESSHTPSASTPAISFTTTPSLLRLRSRPYTGPTHPHTHTQSHSISNPRPVPTLPESPAEARRRNARLEFIEMRRADRMRAAEPRAPRPWQPHNRVLPEGYGHTQPQPPSLPAQTRQTSPVRMSLRQLLSERYEHDHTRNTVTPAAGSHQRLFRVPNGLNGSDSRPAEQAISSNNLLDVAMELDWDAGRPNNLPTQGSVEPQQPQQPQRDARFNHQAFGGATRVPSPLSRTIHRRQSDADSSLFSETVDELVNVNRLERRRPDPSEFLYQGFDVEPARSREYLIAPSLPTPGLGEVFDVTNYANELEHSQHGRSSPGRSPYGGHVASARRQSPPPPTTWEGSNRRSVLGPRRMSPVRTLNSGMSGGVIHPNSFAPGPFRNTVQRMYEANLARENRTAAVQSQSQPRYNPPSIPPLPFENDYSGSLYDSSQQDSNVHRVPPHRLRQPRQESSNMDNSTQLRGFSGNNTREEHEGSQYRSAQQTHRNTWGFRTAPQSPNNDDNIINTSRRPIDTNDFRARQPHVGVSQHRDPRVPLLHATDEHFRRAIQVSRDIVETRWIQGQGAARTRSHSTSSLSVPPLWNVAEDHRNSRPSPETSMEGLLWPRRAQAPINPFSSRHPGTTDSQETTPPTLGNRDAEHVRFAARARRMRRPHDAIYVSNTPIHEYLRIGLGRRAVRAWGDYMRDEDFDESYESLLSLAASLGEVKPRATPDSVIAGLETGLYKNWKTPDSDQRCPICLDDYKPDDPLLKLADCSHWLHRECLQQWLKSANTCPVCRKVVSSPRKDHNQEAGPSRRGDSENSSNERSLGNNSERSVLGEWVPPPWRYGQGA